jgi:HPt (histidine-containing phosphotransfer) domain-containing protein|tara:strand:- start:450 stop:767 length:318 start_codon:yes stop_codon:yes gene_type:complete
MEKPNLNYVNNLSGDDNNVKKLLIDVIKTEFPEEKKEYYENYESKEFKKIEENVHRLKHKISILGLEESYEIANEYEHNLRNKCTDKSDDFDIILLVITEYLKTL